MKNQIFRTTVSPKYASFQLSYEDQYLCIGSCFATHLASYLKTRKFNVLENPFGILYNPVSILNSLRRISENSPYSGTELHSHNGLWHSWDHHGSFKNPDQDLCLENINTHLEQANAFIKKTSVCIITLGTARVYRWKENDSYVANCHKVPAYEFSKELLSVQTTMQILYQCCEILREINPDVKIILSVSPIRHRADGAEANAVSKSTLRVAIDELITQNEDVYYFPSYEIMMDDLRDYRFYEADMIHPNVQAIGYILDLFNQCLFDDPSKSLILRILALERMVAHRSLFPDSEADREMKASIAEKIQTLKAEFPFLAF